jgi:hypothetical protein
LLFNKLIIIIFKILFLINNLTVASKQRFFNTPSASYNKILLLHVKNLPNFSTIPSSSYKIINDDINKFILFIILKLFYYPILKISLNKYFLKKL